jgi:hypothetical protein
MDARSDPRDEDEAMAIRLSDGEAYQDFTQKSLSKNRANICPAKTLKTREFMFRACRSSSAKSSLGRNFP